MNSHTHTLEIIIMAEEEAKVLAAAAKLPLEEQVAHSNWKARSAAYEAIKAGCNAVFDASDPVLAEYGECCPAVPQRGLARADTRWGGRGVSQRHHLAPCVLRSLLAGARQPPAQQLMRHHGHPTHTRTQHVQPIPLNLCIDSARVCQGHDGRQRRRARQGA